MPRRALILSVILFFLLALLPFFFLLAESLHVSGHLSLEAYRRVFLRPETWRLFALSFSLAFLVSLGAGLAGGLLALLFSRTDLPGGNLFTFLFLIPFLLPPVASQRRGVFFGGMGG